MSKNGIAHRLNDLGIAGPAAYKKSKGLNFCCPQGEKNDGLWSPSSVTTILKNKMYLGIMVQGKQTVISYKVHDKVAVPEEDWYMVPDTHEPIIEAELFKKRLTFRQGIPGQRRQEEICIYYLDLSAVRIAKRR